MLHRFNTSGHVTSRHDSFPPAAIDDDAFVDRLANEEERLLAEPSTISDEASVAVSVQYECDLFFLNSFRRSIVITGIRIVESQTRNISLPAEAAFSGRDNNNATNTDNNNRLSF